MQQLPMGPQWTDTDEQKNSRHGSKFVGLMRSHRKSYESMRSSGTASHELEFETASRGVAVGEVIRERLAS